ncbi:MAG: hypothetical protein AB1714_26950 [Acidobacteriota bacterium]
MNTQQTSHEKDVEVHWTERELTIEELARFQGVVATSNVEDLKGDWPDDEPLDAFLATIGEIRL